MKQTGEELEDVGLHCRHFVVFAWFARFSNLPFLAHFTLPRFSTLWCTDSNSSGFTNWFTGVWLKTLIISTQYFLAYKWLKSLKNKSMSLAYIEIKISRNVWIFCFILYKNINQICLNLWFQVKTSHGSHTNNSCISSKMSAFIKYVDSMPSTFLTTWLNILCILPIVCVC